MNMAYENVKQVIEEYGIARMQFEERMKTAFNDVFKTFFEQYPEITAVAWNQYTPYFNDGEPCVFSVGDFFGLAKGQKFNVNGEKEIELNEINSAYDLDLESFPYKGKPSEYVYENRHKYDWYEQSIQAYENASKANPRYAEICDGWKELVDVLSSTDENIYHTAFGDHVFVLATKDGIEVNEFDHD
jgi:hypothetical protein